MQSNTRLRRRNASHAFWPTKLIPLSPKQSAPGFGNKLERSFVERPLGARFPVLTHRLVWRGQCEIAECVETFDHRLGSRFRPIHTAMGDDRQLELFKRVG